MFPEGSKEPYERTRRIIEKLAGPLKATPYRVSITGHTSASKVPPKADYGPWNLSADRANSVRQILEEEGFPPGNIYEVAGRADTDPLFPEDPYIAANRRVTLRSCTRRRRFHPGCSRRFDTIHRLKECCADSQRHIRVVFTT
jgi:chemotaxis protein MotB